MRIKLKNKPQEKAPEIRTPVQQSLTVKEKVDKNETDTNEDKDDAVDLINALPIQERWDRKDDGDDKSRKRES